MVGQCFSFHGFRFEVAEREQEPPDAAQAPQARLRAFRQISAPL